MTFGFIKADSAHGRALYQAIDRMKWWTATAVEAGRLAGEVVESDQQVMVRWDLNNIEYLLTATRLDEDEVDTLNLRCAPVDDAMSILITDTNRLIFWLHEEADHRYFEANSLEVWVPQGHACLIFRTREVLSTIQGRSQHRLPGAGSRFQAVRNALCPRWRPPTRLRERRGVHCRRRRGCS